MRLQVLTRKQKRAAFAAVQAERAQAREARRVRVARDFHDGRTRSEIEWYEAVVHNRDVVSALEHQDWLRRSVGGV